MPNQGNPSAIIRIPIRVIEEIYGKQNCDDAADVILGALRQVSEWDNQYKYEFDYDLNHPNPWYHTMVFTIYEFPDSVRARFDVLLAELGLDPNG